MTAPPLYKYMSSGMFSPSDDIPVIQSGSSINVALYAWANYTELQNIITTAGKNDLVISRTQRLN